jgi:lysophospholipase L1-like esterase
MKLSRRALLGAPMALAAPMLMAAGRAPLAAVPISRMDTRWWRLRHEAKLAELRTTRPELIWLGDSITENFERDGPEPWARYRPVWERFYAPYRAVNLGFKGDATSHLLWRMQHGELEGIAPRAAVVLIGANNMGRPHWPADETIIGIEAVVAEARRRLPATRLLLLSVLPSDRGPWVDETTAAINAGLAQRFHPGGPATYMDVTGLYRRGGALDRALFYDPLLRPPEPALHPTADGMARLAAAIQPTLAGWLRG